MGAVPTGAVSVSYGPRYFFCLKRITPVSNGSRGGWRSVCFLQTSPFFVYPLDPQGLT
jgi:hypothetical protein